jgi:hypothetical protein
MGEKMPYQLTETHNLILLTTESLRFGINRQTGALAHLSRPGDASVVGRAATSAAVDVRLNGQWLSETTRYLSHTVEETEEGAALTVTVALGPLSIDDRFHLVGSLVERTVRVSMLGSTGGEWQLDGVLLTVPRVAIGLPSDCRFEAPACAVRPRLPLSLAARQTLEQPGIDPEFAPGARARWFSAINDCPDVTPGLMIVHNSSLPPIAQRWRERSRLRDRGQSLLVWYVSQIEAATALVSGDGRLADLNHELGLAGWLSPSSKSPLYRSLEGGVQYILLHDGNYPSALDAYHSYYTRTGLEPALYGQPPDWVKDAAIYEVHPGQFGGFLGLAEHVPDLAKMGINVLYLLPVMEFDNRHRAAGRPDQSWDENWLGGGSPYAMKDFEKLEPSLGTEEDFKGLIKTAHKHGIRVLMDFVPQGCALDARYVTEHPEWFCRDEANRMVHSHGWIDTWSFDWANPDYHAYMLDWSLRLMRGWDLDGYRIDAPHGKEPNWDRNIPYHASVTNLGVIQLLEKLQVEIKKIKATGILLCELFGPIFSRSHDLVYDYYPCVMAYELLDRRLSPREFGHWLEDYWRVMPTGPARVCFTETHDTRGPHPPAYKLRGSVAERALFGLLAAAGFVPMIWSGQEERQEDFYGGVIKARCQSEALKSGNFLCNAVNCCEAESERAYNAHEHVFNLIRQKDDEVVWALISLHTEYTPFTFELPVEQLSLETGVIYQLRDLITAELFDEYGRQQWAGWEFSHLTLTPQIFRPYLLRLERV